MKKVDKELLLKDLCARLPYGVKYMRYSWNYDTGQELPIIETLECVDKDGYINHRRVYTVGDIKPYLFPLSSMTDEQKKELQELHFDYISDEIFNDIEFVYHYDCVHLIEWLIKNHFDIYGLIEKGLAIDATGLNIY